MSDSGIEQLNEENKSPVLRALTTCVSRGSNTEEGEVFTGSTIESFGSSGSFTQSQIRHDAVYLAGGSFYTDYNAFFVFHLQDLARRRVTVNHATIRFYATEASTGPTTVLIGGQKSPDMGSVSGIETIEEARFSPRTDNQVEWVIGDLAENEWAESPNIACVIQELLDDPDWIRFNPDMNGISLFLDFQREYTEIDDPESLRSISGECVLTVWYDHCLTEGTNVKSQDDDFRGSHSPNCINPYGCWDNSTIWLDRVNLGGQYLGAWCVADFRYGIPQGAVINYASLTFVALEASTGPMSLIITGRKDLALNEDFTTVSINTLEEARYSVRTENNVDWTLDNWSKDERIESPNIACIVQEWVDDPEWVHRPHSTVYLDEKYAVIFLELQSPANVRQFTGAYLNVWYTRSPYEGVALAGTADIGKLFIHQSQGGISLGGHGAVEATWVMRGGITQNGRFAERLVFRPTPRGGIQLGGAAQLGSRIYNVPVEGGISLGGAAPNDHSYHMSGGVSAAGVALYTTSFVMQGGVIEAGQAAITGLSNEAGQGGIQLGGLAHTSGYSFLAYESAGAVYVEGSAPAGIRSYKYLSTGGVFLDNTLDPAIVNFQFSPSLHFIWRTNSKITGDMRFVWSTGSAAMYWYRIIGRGRQGDECDLVADPCCQKFILNVHARTPAELCEKLSARKFTLPIESVQRFSRPAALSNIFNDWRAQQQLFDRYIAENGMCEELVPIEICKIPECAEFCVNYDLIVDFEFDIPVLQVDSFLEYEAGDGSDNDRSVEISGSAVVRLWRNVPSFSHEADGEVIVAGESHVWPSMYNASGGMRAGGAAYTESTAYVFEAGQWPSTTALGPGTVAESVPVLMDDGDLYVGDRVWLEPDRALSVDPGPVGWPTWAIVDHQGFSEFLVVKGFNLSIPEDVEVIGLQVQMRKVAQQLNIYETHLVLVYGNEIISKNLASNFQWPYMSVATSVYGSNGADGNASFFDSGDFVDLDILRSPDFGVAVRVRDVADQTGCYVGVDWIQVEASYQSVSGQTIRVSGTSDVRSTSYHHTASGGIQLTSADLNVKLGRRYITYGYGSGTAAIVMRGNYATRLAYEATGSISFESSTESRGSYTYYESQGGASLGGRAIVKPYWDTGDGGIHCGGSASMDFRYVAESEAYPIYATGAAHTPEVRLSYEATGGITLDSTTDRACSFWRTEASGDITTSGDADQLPGSVPLDNVVFEFSMSVFEATAIFAKETAVGIVAAADDTLSRCGCAEIPLTIAARHNLARNNIFYQFLTRNNYRPINSFLMRYNSINQSWQANYHYRGLSADTNTTERWDLHYELQCVNEMGATQLGRNIWKLGINVFRKNLSTLEDYDTRIIIALMPETVCETNDYELDFTVLLDTQTGSAVISPPSTIYQVSVYDNIGLFKNMYWVDNPDFAITVSQKGLDAIQRRVDLTDLVYV